MHVYLEAVDNTDNQMQQPTAVSPTLAWYICASASTASPALNNKTRIHVSNSPHFKPVCDCCCLLTAHPTPADNNKRRQPKQQKKHKKKLPKKANITKKE